MTMNESVNGPDAGITEFVTAMIGGQLFGLPISRVQDVFMPERVTQVPLSAPEIAGILNLRGRIVTVIDMRCRLGLAPREKGRPPMAVGIECRGESYGLLIDDVGEVMKLPDSNREVNPVNLDARLAQLSAGVYRLDTQLLVVLDIDRVLHVGLEIKAA
jgi:purine-binding chemotaxis protein CheW